MLSLENLLNNKSNIYSYFAKKFLKKTGVDIIVGDNKKISIAKSCSIIIPFYKNYSFLEKNLASLCHQELSAEFKKNKIEIIIINDGSSVNLENLIRKTRKYYTVVYLKLKNNSGRATARNLGLLHSKNEIIIFLDEDIVVPNDFIFSHLLRHEFLDRCVIVGFRHNITLKDSVSKINKKTQKIIKRPNYKKDFRYKKFIPKNWKNIYNDLPPHSFNKVCFPLKESNFFSNFGNGKIFGVWNLPFMFLTSNASVPRSEILKIGGFDMRFKGWGLEDVHLALKLISNGLYLLPNLHASAYHLIEEKEKKDKKKKYEEFRANLCLYNKLKNEEILIYSEDQWKRKAKKYFKNKFTIKYFPKE